MKKIIGTLILALAGLLLCQPALAQKKLKDLAPTETYPDDTFLSSCPKKRAMIVVAHDDDSGAMSGTIAQLQENGWEIMHLCFEGEDPERRERHRASIAPIVDRVEFIPMDGKAYRNDLDTARYPYLPIPRETFPQVFNTAEVQAHLAKAINDFDPAVIFSLDDKMGGYGHPDHVFISSLVKSMAESGEIKPQRIYQSVYTDHMEEQIMVIRLGNLLKKWGYPNTYELSKKVYGEEKGMPEPTVQVNIQAQAEAKMNLLRSYAESERKNLRKFIPYFEDYPAEKYFAIFDREFFRVLEF